MAITAPPDIDALPTPPDPNDRSTFNQRAYPWSVAQQTLAVQLGAVADTVFDNATVAFAAATTATTQAGIATSGASTATTQAGIATAAASTLTTQADIATTQAGIATTKAAEAAASAASIADGPVTSVNSKTGVVTLVPADIGLTSASQVEMEAGTEAALRAMSPLRVAQAIAALGKGKITRSARASNTALTAADIGQLIDITSGTFTQTIDDLTTLGNGWFVYYRNFGTGDITIDPFGSQTIDGLTSYVMYPGEVRLVQCDGTALRSVVLNAFSKTFTASGSFIDPPGYSLCDGLLWGGGGGGGSGVSVFATGGGGGACCPVKLVPVPGTVRTVTIGSGGAAATAGGNSTFAGFSAYGGGRGISNAGGYGAGGGGVFSAGSAGSTSVVVGGGPVLSSSSYGPDNMGFGGGGTRGTSVYGGGGGGGSGGGAVGDSGGVSVFGGGGGASAGSSSGGPATAGVFGGSGGAGTVNGTGGAGVAPAGGGGGAYNGTGGAGARGELRIWGVI